MTKQRLRHVGYGLPRRSTISSYLILRQDPNRKWGGTQSFSRPPTAYMAQAIFSLPVTVDTLYGYNWRHRGDFWISNNFRTPLDFTKSPSGLIKIEQFFLQLWKFGDVLGGNSKIPMMALIVSTQGINRHRKWEIYLSQVSCRGDAKTLGPSLLIRVLSVI